MIFAKSIEKNNEAIATKLAWSQKKRSENLPTVPSTLEEESQYNVFMRVKSSKEISDEFSGEDPVSILKNIRELKNKFKIK